MDHAVTFRFYDLIKEFDRAIMEQFGDTQVYRLMNDNYYSLLSGEELVEKDGAHLPLRTEPLASAAQFHEMSPEQQWRVVQLHRNQQDVNAGFGHIEICLPKELYF